MRGAGRADRAAGDWPKARRAAGRSPRSSACIARCAGTAQRDGRQARGDQRRRCRASAAAAATSVSGPGQMRRGERARVARRTSPMRSRRGEVGDMDDQRIEARAGPWRRRSARPPRRWSRRRRGRRPSRSAPRPARPPRISRAASAIAASSDAQRSRRWLLAAPWPAAIGLRPTASQGKARMAFTRPPPTSVLALEPCRADRRAGRARALRRRERRHGRGDRSKASAPSPRANWRRSTALGDTEGATLDERRGHACPRVSEAYRGFRRGTAGTRSPAPEEFGGQGLPLQPRLLRARDAGRRQHRLRPAADARPSARSRRSSTTAARRRRRSICRSSSAANGRRR